MMGIFDTQEQQIKFAFEQKYEKEIAALNNLLKVYEAFLDATQGKIKDTDAPNWTILLLLSQVLPLMNNAGDLLARGYLRSSEALIRICSESIILSVYFKEFPETEKEFNALNYRDFYHKHPIEDMLKKVEKEGKFFSPKDSTKKSNLHKIVFDNLYKEPSRFLHSNLDTIYGVTKSYQIDKTDKHYFIKGPQLYPDRILNMAVRHLFNILLFSILALGVGLNIAPDEQEKKAIDEAIKISSELNINGSAKIKSRG